MSVKQYLRSPTDIEPVTERKVKGRKKIHRKKKEFQNASLPPRSFRRCQSSRPSQKLIDPAGDEREKRGNYCRALSGETL
jgi:hypothetical protein